MIENQKDIERRNKDEINNIIEAESGKSITEAIKVLFPSGKETYYRNVKKRPLKHGFISLVKSKLGVDLSRFEAGKYRPAKTDIESIVQDLTRSNMVLSAQIIKIADKLEKLEKQLESVSKKTTQK